MQAATEERKEEGEKIPEGNYEERGEREGGRVSKLGQILSKWDVIPHPPTRGNNRGLVAASFRRRLKGARRQLFPPRKFFR